MSVQSMKAFQLLQKRGFHHVANNGSRQMNRVFQNPKIMQLPKRQFHGKGRMFEEWAKRHSEKFSGNNKNGFGKHDHYYGYYRNHPFFGGYNGCHHNMRHYMRMCRRFGHHGGYWARSAWGGVTVGACLATVISYHNYESIIWAMIHGLFSWFYVIYFALSQYNLQDKTPDELVSIQIKEISNEIEKLNKVYQKVMNEMHNEKVNKNVVMSTGTTTASAATTTTSDIENSDDQNADISKFIDNLDTINDSENYQMLEQLKQRLDKLQNEIAQQNKKL